MIASLEDLMRGKEKEISKCERRLEEKESYIKVLETTSATNRQVIDSYRSEIKEVTEEREELKKTVDEQEEREKQNCVLINTLQEMIEELKKEKDKLEQKNQED